MANPSPVQVDLVRIGSVAWDREGLLACARHLPEHEVTPRELGVDNALADVAAADRATANPADPIVLIEYAPAALWPVAGADTLARALAEGAEGVRVRIVPFEEQFQFILSPKVRERTRAAFRRIQRRRRRLGRL